MSAEYAKAKGSQSARAEEREELAQQLDAIRHDLGRLSETVTRMASGRMERGRNVAHDQLTQAQSAAYERLGEAEDTIRRNPLSSIGIAACLGFLFGLISRRG